MIHLDTTFLVDAIRLIGATALTREASLLTANEAHFARVPGLRVLGYR